MSNTKTINKTIAAYRRFRGLTQEQLAEQLGMKPSTYSMRERQGEISCEMLIEIADILAVDVKEILYDENPPKKKANRAAPLEEYFVVQPTTMELNFLKVIRTLKKKDRQELLDFVQAKREK